VSYRNNNNSQLVVFVQNVISALQDHKVSCLDDAVADALAAKLSPLNDELAQSVREGFDLRALKQENTAKKRQKRSEVVATLSSVVRNIEAANGEPQHFEICGFENRRPWTSVVARQPTDLIAVGDWAEGNKLKFKGNNLRGRVVFEISRCDGRDGEWSFVGLTRRQSFVDKTAVPGKHYTYRVRAVAPRGPSTYSNLATVYSP
jgi:hypothetical protein